MFAHGFTKHLLPGIVMAIGELGLAVRAFEAHMVYKIKHSHAIPFRQ